jgi:hypothetical protein
MGAGFILSFAHDKVELQTEVNLAAVGGGAGAQVQHRFVAHFRGFEPHQKQVAAFSALAAVSDNEVCTGICCEDLRTDSVFVNCFEKRLT